MARRTRHRQVEIFNFSFLDILACTIGLLIFIMVMVFVLQADSVVADASNLIARKAEQVRAARLGAEQDSLMVRQLEEQLNKIPSPVDPRLAGERNSLRTVVEAARTAYMQRSQEVQRAQATLDSRREAQRRTVEKMLHDAEARLQGSRREHEAADLALVRAVAAEPSTHVTFLPIKRAAEEGEPFQVLHVDCHANRVVLLTVGPDGSVSLAGESPLRSIADKNSILATVVRRHGNSINPLVLFWVRPDGIETFEAAQQAIPTNMPRGFEPADADWNFSVASR
jgi:hypothetical protein